MVSKKKQIRSIQIPNSATYTMEPVHVTEDDTLVYNFKQMEVGKQYQAKWHGQPYMLMRDDKDVNIYRFVPDEA